MAISMFLDWPAGWYVLSMIFAAIWAIISFYRRDRTFRPQLVTGIVILCIAFVVENIAVFFGLWNYTGGNWPLMLWPNYFLSALAFYQIVMLVKK